MDFLYIGLMLNLSANQLTCQRDERLLFQQLSFSLNAGEALQVTGPNGAGKTSLLRILVGLLDPIEGQVHWSGQPISRCAEDYRRELAYVGHKIGVRPGLTVLENLQMTAALNQLNNEIQLPEILATLQLTELAQEYAFRLSAGQQQRLALGMLLIQKAKLWVLDEPFTAIDVDGVQVISQLLAQHVAAGGMLVYTTHQHVDLPGIKVQQLRVGL